MHPLYSVDKLEDLYNIENINCNIKKQIKNSLSTYEDNKMALILAIQKKHFNSYFNLYEKIKEEDIKDIKNIYKNEIKEIINDNIDKELEKEYKFPISNKRVAFLLDNGADPEYLLKYSIEKKDDVNLLKCLVGYCELEENFQKLKQTSYRQAIENFLNSQLEKCYDKKTLNTKAIEFLMSSGAKKERALNLSISKEGNHFISFMNFINEDKSILRIFEQNKDLNSLFLLKLDKWMEELTSIKQKIDSNSREESNNKTKYGHSKWNYRFSNLNTELYYFEKEREIYNGYSDFKNIEIESLRMNEAWDYKENERNFANAEYDFEKKQQNLQNNKEKISSNLYDNYNINPSEINDNISYLQKLKDKYYFILQYGTNKEKIFIRIKNLIGEKNFEKFKSFVDDFKEYIVIDEIMKDIDWDKIYSQLNNWLEDRNINCNKNNIKFLLEYGATKKDAIELSINRGNFKSFRNLLDGDKNLLEELKKEKELEGKIKAQFDSWLKDNIDSTNIYDIKLLLWLGASKQIIYKRLIEKISFERFKFFIENFREDGISLEETKKEEALNNSLQKQIDTWLEEKNNEHSIKSICYNKNDVNFLLNCGAIKENAIKLSIELKHYMSFKNLLDIGANIDIIIKDNYWNKDDKYTEQIKIYKERKCGYTKYLNKEGHSNIFAYEMGADYIKVYFRGGYKYNTYTYSYKSAGEENIEKMKDLALEGQGLHSYINRYVRDKYEEDSRAWTQLR